MPVDDSAHDLRIAFGRSECTVIDVSNAAVSLPLHRLERSVPASSGTRAHSRMLPNAMAIAEVTHPQSMRVSQHIMCTVSQT